MLQALKRGRAPALPRVPRRCAPSRSARLAAPDGPPWWACQPDRSSFPGALTPLSPEWSPRYGVSMVTDLPFVFDAHVDSLQRALDLGEDLGQRAPHGHLDLVRGREGGLGAVVLVSWVDPDMHGYRSRERTQELMGVAHDLAERHPDLIRLVGNGQELDAARTEGPTAGILGIEGGHSIENSLEVLGDFFERGLRVMTLVWNNHLPWVRSCQVCDDDTIPAGLSPFGRNVVSEMNRLGILVDLSHAGERSFFDALECSSMPAIASHSGCYALHDHPRNLTDAQLRALADRGGVMGVVFHPGFLDADARAEEGRVRKGDAYLAVDPEHITANFVAQQGVMAREAAPYSMEGLVDHVVHAAEVAGAEHVGLGSDYDGIERAPAGLEDASCYPALADALANRGFSTSEVDGIMGANMRRVFARATGEGTVAGGSGNP